MTFCLKSSSLYLSILNLVFILVVIGTDVSATTVLKKSFADLTREAEVIAVGTVTKIEKKWNTEQLAPFTYVTFSDLELLKGENEGTDLTLKFLGGELPDGTTLNIIGVPKFIIGERNVVFSVGNRWRFCPLVGLWQGLYRVIYDTNYGVETIQNYAYIPIEIPEGTVSTHSLSTQKQKKSVMTLSSFKLLIQKELLNVP